MPRLLILPLFAAFWPAAAQAQLPASASAARTPSSLVTGRWVESRFRHWARCPDTDTACPYMVFDGRWRQLSVLSGPAVPRTASVRTVSLNRPNARGRQVMLVGPGDGSDAWVGLVIDQARSDEACVDAAQLRGFGIAPPPGSREANGNVCVPLGRRRAR